MRISALLAVAGCLLLVPAARAEGVATVERCDILAGGTWVACEARMPVGGASGVPGAQLWWGGSLDASCGHGSLARPTDVEAPEVGTCSAWVGAGAANATIPTPHPSALLAGRA